PNPGPTKKKASINALAATRHLSHADAANATSATIAIHIHDAMKMAQPSHKCDHNHPLLSSPAFRKKRINIGIQVTAESRVAITRNFPTTYSAREIGRPRISGKALFARSDATSCGPCQVISKNEIQACAPRNARKK